MKLSKNTLTVLGITFSLILKNIGSYKGKFICPFFSMFERALNRSRLRRSFGKLAIGLEFDKAAAAFLFPIIERMAL